jgi:hypothetical protein
MKDDFMHHVITNLIGIYQHPMLKTRHVNNFHGVRRGPEACPR